jgi:hypothetical protein
MKFKKDGNFDFPNLTKVKQKIEWQTTLNCFAAGKKNCLAHTPSVPV